MKAFYIPTNDGYLFCKVLGRGEPLLFLHGNGEDHTIFEHQFSFFSRYYKVIALDTRGHGRSDHGSGVLSFQKIAEDIRTVMDYLEIGKLSIIGFSDGGNVAFYFAGHYPDLVSKIVVSGANIEADAMDRKALTVVNGFFLLAQLFGRFSRKWRQKKEVLDLMLNELDLSEEILEQIPIPVFVLAGDHDVIREEHTERISRLLPNGRLEILQNADHYLIVKKPERFNKLVLDFLADE